MSGARGGRGGRRADPTRAPEPTPGSDAGLGERVRLQKLLARAGISSRRGGEELMSAGKVAVNGRVVTELGVKVDPVSDRVTVEGKPVVLEQPVYLVLNKPDGCVSSAEPRVDDRGRPTVVSLLGPFPQRVYPVGRLDYHSRGVLLLTNDGDLAARLLHPRSKVPRTYHVKFQGKLDAATLEALDAGVTLEDGTLTRPLHELFVFKQTQTNTWVQMALTQGLYRQIRRMGEAVGHPVLKLLRVAFGDITSDGLDDGQWRHLREPELAALRSALEVGAVPSVRPPAKARAATSRTRAGKAERTGTGKPARTGAGGATGARAHSGRAGTGRPKKASANAARRPSSGLAGRRKRG